MSEKRSNLITVGLITGVFGIKGWVKVKSYTQPAESLINYQPWWLKTRHGVKPVELAEHQSHSDGWIVRLAGVEDRTQAEIYARCEIAIERNVLPTLGEDDFYWHQLIGLKVVSIYGGKTVPLGSVSKMMETGANDVIVVKPDASSVDDRERLVPYVFGDYVTEVCMEQGVIKVDWDPEF